MSHKQLAGSISRILHHLFPLKDTLQGPPSNFRLEGHQEFQEEGSISSKGHLKGCFLH